MESGHLFFSETTKFSQGGFTSSVISSPSRSPMMSLYPTMPDESPNRTHHTRCLILSKTRPFLQPLPTLLKLLQSSNHQNRFLSRCRGNTTHPPSPHSLGLELTQMFTLHLRGWDLTRVSRHHHIRHSRISHQ